MKKFVWTAILVLIALTIIFYVTRKPQNKNEETKLGMWHRSGKGVETITARLDVSRLLFLGRDELNGYLFDFRWNAPSRLEISVDGEPLDGLELFEDIRYKGRLGFRRTATNRHPAIDGLLTLDEKAEAVLISVAVNSKYYRLVYSILSHKDVNKQKTVKIKTAETAETAETIKTACCSNFFFPDIIVDKYLCGVQGYMATYVNEVKDCLGRNNVPVNTEITFALINKIKEGGIGDADMDGNCNFNDIKPFLDCIKGVGSYFTCNCIFDWNNDSEINLSDYAVLQRVIGSGNSYWEAEHAVY